MLKRVLPALLLVASGMSAATPAATEIVQFAGFTEGDVVRDQYMFRGLRIGPDERGGPFYDDAELFAFLLDTPPGLLNLNPLTAGSGAGRVHASVGTYVFDMVDPSNPFVPSFSDHAEVVVVLVDKGNTVLTAYGAGGEVLGTDTLTLDGFVFTPFRLSVSAPGIQRFTLTTPLEPPTIGALVDTVVFETPAELPSREIEIDIRPGSTRNTIRLRDNGTVPVAILSGPGFEPELLDPAKVLFQHALAVSHTFVDRNHDRVRDLVLSFRVGDLQGLDTSSTSASLSAVDTDGTSLRGSDSVIVQRGPSPPPFGGDISSSGPRLDFQTW